MSRLKTRLFYGKTIYSEKGDPRDHEEEPGRRIPADLLWVFRRRFNFPDLQLVAHVMERNQK